MKKVFKIVLIVVVVIVVIGFVVLNFVLRNAAIDTITHPPEDRPEMIDTPADYDLAYEEVAVVTEDGLNLHCWFVPGENGATIIVQHGTPGGRQDSLFEADFLNRHGFNVLFGSFRAHDENDGNMITFGANEVKDLEAWYQYLLTRDDVNPDKIGLYGESMGGGTSILHAAENEGISALATGSGFAFTQDTVEVFIKHELGTPDWATPIIARFLLFWAEREGDFKSDDIDTEKVICDVSPRPVFSIQGLQDDKISPDNGQLLYDAACEPKEVWLLPNAGHVNFEEFEAEEYEERLVSFFEQWLLTD